MPCNSVRLSTACPSRNIALRQCVRQRGFALTVVCTLAVTVGATTAVFSVVNTVLVRALPFSSPERLVWIASDRLAKQTLGFGEIAAGADDHPERVPVGSVARLERDRFS